MNIRLPNGNVKSLCLIQDLSYIPLCEESEDFQSKQYKNYKTYRLPKPSKYSDRFYDPDDYIEYDSLRMKIKNCHMCDIRRTGCMSDSTPRYYCKKEKKSVQTTLNFF